MNTGINECPCGNFVATNDQYIIKRYKDALLIHMYCPSTDLLWTRRFARKRIVPHLNKLVWVNGLVATDKEPK